MILNNISFKGHFANTPDLRERLSEDSLCNNLKVLSALERMNKVQDNKMFKYVEYNKNSNWNGMRCYGRYGVIVDENDKIMEELIKKKKDIQSEYDTALSEMNKELNESKYNIDDTEGNVDSSSDNDKQFKMWFNDKVDFLGIQLRHDIFNVIYRGYELPKKDTDSKDSDSD